MIHLMDFFWKHICSQSSGMKALVCTNVCLALKDLKKKADNTLDVQRAGQFGYLSTKVEQQHEQRERESGDPYSQRLIVKKMLRTKTGE